MSLHALVVTNMYPSASRPEHGRFVYDQVAALRRLEGIELEVFSFGGGDAGAYLTAGRRLRAAYPGVTFDVVHAHFGLTAWPALGARGHVRAVTLHGTDLAHPRSRPISLAALRLMDIVGVASRELGDRVPAWALRRGAGVQELPCGVDLERFRPLDRGEARRALGLRAEGPYLLFAADPSRPEKRFDLARRVAAAVGAELLALRSVPPERVPLYVNAANAVLVPSDREGFGLAVLEALACEVPVLATPHGVASEALPGLDGVLCAAFDLSAWSAVAARALAVADPRLDGARERAASFSADLMARRVADAWAHARELVNDG